ncbi:hypothetical protein [Halomonas sp.]|uniref:hypothetical protein n=1 Tax=Halomonas sp. TaxID=1486246 RepID=UPI0035647830
MTLKEIQQIVTHHWWIHHRKKLRRLTPEQIQSESMGLAHLVRMEMDSLKAIGLDEKTAWSESAWMVFREEPPTPEDVEQGME